MIRGEKTVLRAWEKEDAERRRKWTEDPTLARRLGFRYPMSLVQQEAWIEEAGRKHQFAIETLDGHLIGGCGFSVIYLQHRYGEIRPFVVAEEDFRDGEHDVDALRTLCRWAFSFMNLHRVGVTLDAEDEEVIRCFEEVGFTREGQTRQSRYYGGAYHDEVFMGLLDRETRLRSDEQ